MSKVKTKMVYMCMCAYVGAYVCVDVWMQLTCCNPCEEKHVSEHTLDYTRIPDTGQMAEEPEHTMSVVVVVVVVGLVDFIKKDGDACATWHVFRMTRQPACSARQNGCVKEVLCVLVREQ